jgi:hypothetical protein
MKWGYMRILIIIFVIIFPVMLLSCSPGIPSYIIPNNVQCEFPCWSNYTPLASNEKEVEDSLKSNKLIDSIEMPVYSPDGISTIYSKTKKPVGEIEIRFLNHIVQSTYINLNEIPLGKIIKIFNNPDWIAIGRADSGDYIQIHYFLLNDKEGVILHILNKGTDNEITENSDVIGIVITDPSIIDQTIMYYNTNLSFNAKMWKGYGKY